MLLIQGDRLQACKELGDYVSSLGVVPLGRSFLLFSAQHCVSALEECDKLLSKGGMEPEVLAALVGAKKDLVELTIKASTEMIRSAQIQADVEKERGNPKPMLAPRQTAVPTAPVQVNVVGKTVTVGVSPEGDPSDI